MWGIYRERWKWEASISVSGYASASLLSKGRLALVYHDTPMLASHFCPVISHFLSSSNFWLDLCIAAWRPFRAMFSSIFICIEISRCLVSNSLGFVQFGVTVVEISCLKGRWRKVEKFWTFFFLEKIISTNPKQISSSPFGENQLRPCSSRCSSPLISAIAQSVQFIAWSRVKKLPVFFKNTIKILLGFRYFVISHSF